MLMEQAGRAEAQAELVELAGRMEADWATAETVEGMAGTAELAEEARRD